MSLQSRCDKCGKVKDPHNKEDWPSIESREPILPCHDTKLDLCPKCFQLFLEWLKE